MRYRDNAGLTDLITGFDENKIQPFFAVELELDTGTFREWTGYGDLVLASNISFASQQEYPYSKTFTGGGSLLSFSPYREDATMSAKHLVIGVSGLKASNLEAALEENYQYRIARIYTGCIYPDASIDHFLLFQGWISDMQVQETANSGMAVMINVESPMTMMARSNAFHYTAEEQIALAEENGTYPQADNSLKRIVEIQDIQVEWS